MLAICARIYHEFTGLECLEARAGACVALVFDDSFFIRENEPTGFRNEVTPRFRLPRYWMRVSSTPSECTSSKKGTAVSFVRSFVEDSWRNCSNFFWLHSWINPRLHNISRVVHSDLMAWRTLQICDGGVHSKPLPVLSEFRASSAIY